MNKKISYSELEKMLSSKQMKNVLGGSGSSCSSSECDSNASCGSGANYPYNNYCIHSTTLGCVCASAGG
jgi:natural product precursor